jgi:PAP_fibrillin
VFFQRPVLCLGSEVCLRIGPESSVQLTTTYLDERMRLGRGSRGSRFIFIRGGYSDQAGEHARDTSWEAEATFCHVLPALVASDGMQHFLFLCSMPCCCAINAHLCPPYDSVMAVHAADMDQVGQRRTTATGWALLAAAVVGLVAGTVRLAHGASLASRAAAVVVGLLAGAIATVVWRGGQNEQ